MGGAGVSAVGVAIFVITLIVMIMIHEAGHYSTARAFGMKIEEYFLGFGPRLFSWRRGETEYGVKAILAGGYVKIAGMNPLQAVDAADVPRTFGAKPAWQRAIVLVAGSTTHFLVGVLLLTFSFSVLGVIGDPTTTLDSVTASRTARTGVAGPAEQAGIAPGDRVVAVDQTPVTSWPQLQGYIRARAGMPLAITVNRAGHPLTLTVTPAQTTDPSNNQTIGFIGVAPRLAENRQSLPVAFWSGIKGVGSLMVDSVRGIGHLFSPKGLGSIFSSVTKGRKTASSDQAVGLVGGARLAGQAVQTGQGQYLVQILAAFIVFLGVLNLAPLPPLDGGHLALLLIEKVRGGKAVDMRKVIPVAAFVLSIFVTLSLVILYLDVVHPAANPFQ
ncbi:MAG: M50 family metallopeptidase [Actinomycetota bacterium]